MHILIVGGGFSGSAACLQLIGAGRTDLHITLLERHPRQLNRGVAYSAGLSQQLLNVPAGRMGLSADDPTGFHRWATLAHPEAAPDDFLQRRLFGDYVKEAFNEALRAHPDKLTVLMDEAIGINRTEGRLRVALRSGSSLEADHVLLALGSAPPAHIPRLTSEASTHPGYIPWPWVPGALDAIDQEASVAFVGSGLTMVDLVLSLADQGHRGPVSVLSRRGFLPRPHATHPGWAFTKPPPDMASSAVVDLLAWVREEVAQAVEHHVPWQGVIDSVRPHVQGWWQVMPLKEREAFLRHLRPFWEVHRHRMPRPLHERLHRMQAEQRLKLKAVRLQGITVEDGRLMIAYRTRGAATLHRIGVDHLINCTGPQSDSRRIEHPLLVNLLDQGMASWDGLHMGLRCTAQGAVIDLAGRTSNDLHLIGPMCKATLWECTAVPEIREQVRQVVEQVLRRAPHVWASRP